MTEEIKKSSDALLSVRDLEVVYTSAGAVIHAVNGVSLEVRRGKSLGLVGETGAGKTTIAKSIMGILPDPPAKVLGGEIFLDGENLLKVSDKEMRKIRGKKVSMIFQDPMTALNPLMTVGDQIAEVISLHEHGSKKESMHKAMEMLEMVGIPAERYSEFPHQFSGGDEAARGYRYRACLQSRASVGRRAYHRSGCYHPGAGAGLDCQAQKRA